MVKELKETEFDEKIKEGKVLVDFFAVWCGPCRMLGPVIEEVSNIVKDYTFYKVNVDENENVTKKYGIMTIPTLLLFENGELKETLIGFRPKEELLEILK